MRGKAALCALLILALVQGGVCYDGGGGGGDYGYYNGGDEDQSRQENPVNAGGRSSTQQHPPKNADPKQQQVGDLALYLLDGYNRNRLPVSVDGPVKVEVEIAVIQFIEISTSQEYLELEGWWRFWWTDPRLSWNETYWGVSSITLTGAQPFSLPSDLAAAFARTPSLSDLLS